MNTTRQRTISPAVIGIALVAAALGHVYFGMRGLTLWVPVAVIVTVALHLLHRHFPRATMTLALLAAAVVFGHASTLGWAGANAPDGTRYKASPIGLLHVREPRKPVSPVSECRWYLADAHIRPCAKAAGADDARRQLLAVFPLVCLSVLACVLGALAQWRRRSRAVEVDRGPGLLAAGSGLLALWLFSRSVDVALPELVALNVGTGGSLGVMEMMFAILVCLAAGTAPSRS